MYCHFVLKIGVDERQMLMLEDYIRRYLISLFVCLPEVNCLDSLQHQLLRVDINVFYSDFRAGKVLSNELVRTDMSVGGATTVSQMRGK